MWSSPSSRPRTDRTAASTVTPPPGGFDVVTFLSDFGRRDVFVGVCHGVIAARAPHARVIDLTHEVTPHDVEQGALLLSRAVEHLPVAVHLGVVDPGVGTTRRGIAVVTGRGDVLIGPDNGLLVLSAEVLGGVEVAHELTEPSIVSPSASATFHGRDVFAPAAGTVAAGTPVEQLGPPVDHLHRLDIPAPGVDPGTGELDARVVLVDRFGNLQLDAGAEVADRLGWSEGDEVTVSADGRTVTARIVRTFGELAADELGLYPDSDRKLALTVNTGSAAEHLGVGRGARITVRPTDLAADAND